MKGIVFTIFLDFVEENYGPDMADDIIESAGPENGGAYTAVGTYPAKEMAALVAALAQRTDRAVPDLLRIFGQHLGATFQRGYPQYFQAASDLFDFLASIDGYIHIEVLKLYPDAELPSFLIAERDDRSISLDYRSVRCMEALAEGLIESAAAYYRQPVSINQQELDIAGERVVRFTVAAV